MYVGDVTCSVKSTVLNISPIRAHFTQNEFGGRRELQEMSQRSSLKWMAMCMMGLSLCLLLVEQGRLRGGYIMPHPASGSLTQTTNTPCVTTIVIAGFTSCSDFEEAIHIVHDVLLVIRPKVFELEVIELPNKPNFTSWLRSEELMDIGSVDDRAKSHTTSPFIFEKESRRFIGDEKALEAYSQNAIKLFGFGPARISN